MNEYDFDSDQDLNDTVDLSEEEATAAAMLGLGSTKRLTKKQYADFKKKAQEIVSQASVPSKTAGKAAKGIVKGGGQKSAEVSARTFSKALEKGPIKVPSGPVISDLPQVSGKMGAALEKAKSAAAGVPWSPADDVINLSGPSRGSIMDVLSRGGQSAVSALKKIGVSPAALESAGKFLSKGARAAGPVAAVTGAAIDLADITSAGEGSDKPGKQLTSEEMAALYPGTPVDYTPASSMRSDVEKQTSTPAYDVNTEGEIIKAALSQPQSPEYTQALQKRKQERERYVSYLNNSDLFSVEKDRLLAEYDEQYPLEKEANQDVESLNQKKTALQQKITQTESDFAKTSGPFSSDRLNKQLESYRKELAGLSSPQVDRMMAATPEPSANSILSQLEQGTQSQPKPSSPVAAPKPAQDGVMTKTATGTGQPTSAGIAKQDREDDLTKVIGAESARKVSEYEDLMRRFQEAQDRANQMRMMAGIGEGAELLGASIAGVKPTDASFYRQMAEQADLLPKQFKEAEDFKKETRRNDPSSEESESARNLLKSQGITVPDNISAAFIEKQYPQFANILARKEAARLEDKRIRERQEDKDEERVRREKLQLNEDQNKYLDQRQRDFQRDKTQDAYLEVKRALDQIDDYLKDPNPVKAGALSTYLYGKINDPTSAIREQEQKLFGKAGSILDQMKQFASMAATGKIPVEKANQFKSLVNTKLAGYETSIKQKLDPLVEGGKRYQLSPEQVVSNLAGPVMWKKLYETPFSEKKSTIKLDTKLVGKAGKSFTDPKTGKRYIVNPDEESATEL